MSFFNQVVAEEHLRVGSYNVYVKKRLAEGNIYNIYIIIIILLL
jgi:hypothetical protein